MHNKATVYKLSNMLHIKLICSKYAANAATIFLMMFFRVPTSNLSFLQSLMQIYSKLPDLGSMLQLGNYAADMQQHAATCAF